MGVVRVTSAIIILEAPHYGDGMMAKPEVVKFCTQVSYIKC